MASAVTITLALAASSLGRCQDSTDSVQQDALTQATAAREPQGLRAAAELGLRSVINDLTRDLKAGSLPADFPFDVNDLSELKNAKLGLSFEIHTIQPQTLLCRWSPYGTDGDWYGYLEFCRHRQ